MAKLTQRQQEFLRALIKLHNQEGAAIHYSVVAQYMGVGNVATYEMLRFLEGLDLVQRQFSRSEEDRGPGRTQVGFIPNPHAIQRVSDLWGKDLISEEWTKVKVQILEKLRLGKKKGYDDFLIELLDRLPNQPSHTAHMAEMVTALILGLHSLREHTEASKLRSILKRIELPGELGLSAIPGMSVGLSLVERINRQLSDVLLNQANKFQTALLELNAEKRRILAEFTREVAEFVGG